MAFGSLADKLQGVLKKIRGKGKINEADIKEAMREIKLALLEADVNFKVVKDFVTKVSEKSVGASVLESITPGQQIVKIVHDELAELLGGTNSKVIFASKPPTIIMMVGLQGAGKTTTCAKLSSLLKKDGKRPLMVACDIYRPAAIKQLMVVGESVGVPVYAEEDSKNPVQIVKNALIHADKHGNDVVIIDTAGRLHINEELMGELVNIKKVASPHEILLVIDSQIGQDATTVASSFNEQLGIDGLILTKLDGDARGGGALSVKAVTGKPIKFVGSGEKLTDLEPFYPDRMASRILGMGDILTLVDKAQMVFDEKKAGELEAKIRKNEFTLDDYLEQMESMKDMGSMEQILSMLPGVNSNALKGMSIDEKALDKPRAIIKSMTKTEKVKPSIINASRKMRIAKGSGTNVSDVNKLLNQFEQTNKMMKQFSNPKAMKKMKFPFM